MTEYEAIPPSTVKKQKNRKMSKMHTTPSIVANCGATYSVAEIESLLARLEGTLERQAPIVNARLERKVNNLRTVLAMALEDLAEGKIGS